MMERIKKNRDRKGKANPGSEKTDIHVSIDNPIYDRLFKMQKELVGNSSYSGIINTALDGFMDDRGY